MSRTPDEKGRRAGELNQFGCSMTGYSFQVMDLAGPGLAVVVFGERDCASAFPRVSAEFAGHTRWNVYTVALGETDVVAGLAEQRLRECLTAVAARMIDGGDAWPPVIEGHSLVSQQIDRDGVPVILVLSTCLSEMTGADPVPICREVSEATGVKVIPVATGGLRLRNQAEVVDTVGAVLIDAIGDRGEVDPRAVNLVGYQTDAANDVASSDVMFRAEAAAIIKAMGGRMNSAVPAGAVAADWRRLPLGGLTFVSDSSIMRQVSAALESRGGRVIELLQPRGLAATDSFYKGIAAALETDPAPILDSWPQRQEAVQAIAEARARFAGMRLAYGIGTIHNFRPDVLAMEGLANLPFFLELGFDVEVVIQERDYPEVHQRIRRNLDALGVTVPYRLYYEPAVLEPAIRDGRFDCAYVADFMRDQVMRAGIPMLRFGDMSSGYGFAGRYVRQIFRTLGGLFDKRYARYVRGNDSSAETGRGGHR